MTVTHLMDYGFKETEKMVVLLVLSPEYIDLALQT